MADALLTGLLGKEAFLKENIIVSDIAQNRLDYM
jgi:pyrroline-5-carboxylate reductase